MRLIPVGRKNKYDPFGDTIVFVDSIGISPLTDRAYDIGYINSSYACIVSPEQRYNTIDISDVNDLLHEAYLSEPNVSQCTFIEMVGSYAFCSGSKTVTGDKFTVFNNDNPIAPTADATLIIPNNKRFRVAPSGNVGILASSDGIIRSIDVSTPSAMFEISSLAIPEAYAVDISADGNTAFIGTVDEANLIEERIYSVDISNPVAMVILDTLQAPLLKKISDLRVSGNVLYGCSRGNNSVFSIDISNISAMAHLDVHADAIKLIQANSIVLSDNHDVAAVCGYGDGYVSTIDISDPSNISVKAYNNHSFIDQVYGLILEGNYVFAGGRIAVVSLDISGV